MDWLWVALLAVVPLVGLGLALGWSRRRPRRPRVAAPGAPPAKLREGLPATRRRLADQLQAALGQTSGDAVLAELEDALVTADVGVRTAAELVGRVRRRIGRDAGMSEVGPALREEIATMLRTEAAPEPSAKPWIVLVTGVNGVGKTSTIGKLAALHRAAGRRVLLVAADTFRAAAIEQLAVWAERSGAELIRQATGADPSAVVFDGLKAARARGVDVVLIDTAGRLHTRTNLMEELRKVRRVVMREDPTAPHETLIVLDATTGQNAVSQARTFAEAVGVTGVVLTKLDGTARGGVVIAVRHELDLPVRYVGVGEAIDDLRPFDPGEFVEALFEPETPARTAAGAIS